jgi:hypothetical protein
MSEVIEGSQVEVRQHYEAALMRFQAHVKRAADGTFQLDVGDGKSIEVDPVLFEELKRSLEETNKKIKQGELKPEQVLYVNYAYDKPY